MECRIALKQKTGSMNFVNCISNFNSCRDYLSLLRLISKLNTGMVAFICVSVRYTKECVTCFRVATACFNMIRGVSSCYYNTLHEYKKKFGLYVPQSLEVFWNCIKNIFHLSAFYQLMLWVTTFKCVGICRFMNTFWNFFATLCRFSWLYKDQELAFQ